jgi:hypothetical protein
MPDIIAVHGHDEAKKVANTAKNQGSPLRVASADGFASGAVRRARCPAMMPKRVVAAVVIAAMVLAGGSIIVGLFA